MKEITIGIVALVLIAVAFFALRNYEPPVVTYPNYEGWVTDTSDVLAYPAQTSVEELLQSYKDDYGHEIAVLTVPSLQGMTIEQYGIQIADRWKVGNAETDNGVIFIIATEDRKVRIEVGKGAEGMLTDAETGRILDDVVVPYLKVNDWENAIFNGVVAINESLISE